MYGQDMLGYAKNRLVITITKICLYMPSNGWAWRNYFKLWMGRAKLFLRMCWYGQEMQCYRLVVSSYAKYPVTPLLTLFF